MRFWMLGLSAVLFVATSGVAQEVDEVAPMEGGVTSVLVRTPTTRTAPAIAADVIQLPATAALAPGAGFNVAGYVEAAPATFRPGPSSETSQAMRMPRRSP